MVRQKCLNTITVPGDCFVKRMTAVLFASTASTFREKPPFNSSHAWTTITDLLTVDIYLYFHVVSDMYFLLKLPWYMLLSIMPRFRDLQTKNIKNWIAHAPMYAALSTYEPDCTAPRVKGGLGKHALKWGNVVQKIVLTNIQCSTFPFLLIQFRL